MNIRWCEKDKKIFSSANPNLNPATKGVPRKFCLYVGYASLEYYALLTTTHPIGYTRWMCMSLEPVTLKPKQPEISNCARAVYERRPSSSFNSPAIPLHSQPSLLKFCTERPIFPCAVCVSVVSPGACNVLVDVNAIWRFFLCFELEMVLSVVTRG